MNPLERLFRRQFRAEGDAFVFVRGGREVRFSAGEVEELVENWRLLWLGPLVWGIFFVFGVVGPLLLWWNDMGAGAAVLVIATVGFVIAVLGPPLMKPSVVADAKLPFEADAGWQLAEAPTWWGLVYYGVMAFIFGSAALFARGSGLSMLNLFLMWAAFFALYAWKFFRHRRDEPVNPQRDLVSNLIMGTMVVAVVTVTALNPQRELLDLATAWTLVGIALLVAGTALWKRLSQRPPQA